jgi:hypothetical protein
LIKSTAFFVSKKLVNTIHINNIPNINKKINDFFMNPLINILDNTFCVCLAATNQDNISNIIKNVYNKNKAIKKPIQ